MGAVPIMAQDTTARLTAPVISVCPPIKLMSASRQADAKSANRVLNLYRFNALRSQDSRQHPLRLGADRIDVVGIDRNGQLADLAVDKGDSDRK